MATTRIIPMHISKGKTIAQCLSDRTEYAMNPDKTEAGEFVSSFACDPKTADMEFLRSIRGLGICPNKQNGRFPPCAAASRFSQVYKHLPSLPSM